MARIFAALILFFLAELHAQEFRAVSRANWTDKHNFVTSHTQTNSSWGVLRYEIHAHPNDQAFVDRVVQVLTVDAPALLEYFHYASKEVLHIVISDEETLANGSATVFPRNLIFLNTYPPSGHDYLTSEDDFIRGLVLHELVHILHMDQTNGILDLTRSLFGSIGKLGGVVPRWFSEGIATWAESHFTKGGRLKSRRLDYATRYYLGSKSACRTLDCLDEPGSYPHGSLAYWAGAKFIEWLENQKPGSTRCLVSANSNEFPFFLHTSFKKCHEQEPAALYQKFISNYAPIKEEKWSAPNFQKGMALYNDEMIFSAEGKDYERLTLLNLSNSSEREIRLPFRLHQIHHVNSRGELVVSGMSSSPSTTWRRWWAINLENLEISEKTSNAMLAIDYWLEDYQVKREANHVSVWQNEIVLKVFPDLVAIRDIGKKENELWLSRYDASLEKPYVIGSIEEDYWQQDRPFEVILTCQDKFLLQDEDGLFVLKNNEAFHVSNPDNIVEILSNENYQVVFTKDDFKRPEIIKAPCDNLFDQLSLARKKVSATRAVANNVQTPRSSYPSLHHFKPGYWFFNFQTGDSVTSWNVFTSISDPLDRHFLSLAASWYPTLNEVTPNVSYGYDFYDYIFTIAHEKSYQESGLPNDIDEKTETTFSISKQYTLGNFEFIPSFYRSWRRSRDFISSRDIVDTGLRFTTAFVPILGDQFIQMTTLNGRLFYSQPQLGQNYWGGQVRLDSRVRLTSSLGINSIYSYGRLSKTGFVSGVLFAGGSNDAYSSNFHEFYGLDRAQAFGNTIQTARVQLDQEVFSIFRSRNLLPIYFRTVHLLVGIDWIKPERVLIDRRLLRYQDLYSYNIGTKISTRLAYYLPVDFEIFHSRLKNPIGEDQSRWLFLLKADIF